MREGEEDEERWMVAVVVVWGGGETLVGAPLEVKLAEAYPLEEAFGSREREGPTTLYGQTRGPRLTRGENMASKSYRRVTLLMGKIPLGKS